MGRKYTSSSCKTNKSWGQLELQLQASLALFLLFFSETRFSSCCFECHKVHIKRQKKNPADVADLVYLHSFRTPPLTPSLFIFLSPICGILNAFSALLVALLWASENDYAAFNTRNGIYSANVALLFLFLALKPTKKCL